MNFLYYIRHFDEMFNVFDTFNLPLYRSIQMSLLEQIQQLTGHGLTSLDLQRTLSRRLQAVTTTLIINVRNINLLEIHFIIHSFTIKASILSFVCRKLSLRAHLHFAKVLMVASSNARTTVFLNASALTSGSAIGMLVQVFMFNMHIPLIVVGQEQVKH